MNDSLYKISITGKDSLKLINKMISIGIPCEDLSEKSAVYTFYSSYKDSKKIKALSEKYECECIFPDKKRIPEIFTDLFARSGLIFGLIISLVASYILSGMILNIKIDNDSVKIRNDILSVLNENGVGIGSYTRDIDLIKLERELKGKVSGISWAGISAQGSTLIIDTINNIPIPESNSKRLPSDVVAVCDCVVDKVQVYNGELNITVGSGVRAGEVIISGKREKEIKTGKDKKPKKITQYLRADGKVFGTYEKTLELEQSYQSFENIPTGKIEDLKLLDIFGLEIPMYLNKPTGYLSFKTDPVQLSLFGYDLPIGLTDVEYECYEERPVTYTEEEIMQMIERSINDYKKNFLSDIEIKDIKKDIKKSETGISAKITFTLYGEVGEQVDIFLKDQ
ncbi:MAG: sporulation protein YqfD [Ruminococcus sp.]|nr:sporulation protein YqfD [Ruminococcus sp.]